MANLSIELPDTFQIEFASLLAKTAKEVLVEVKQQELNHGKDFMTITECCDYMNVSYGTLNMWIKKLELKVIVVQGKTFISKQTLLEFLKNHEV